MAETLRVEVLRGLPLILRPVVRFLLRYGIGYKEFSAVCKAVFVDVASSEFGLRGRPTNASRVAAMTGISRKEIRLLRSAGQDFTSLDALTASLNPLTVVLHFWHSDPEFSAPGRIPRPLLFADGPGSFSMLVRKYVGDIPPGAIRTELRRNGAVRDLADGRMEPVTDHYTPRALDAGFVRSMTFSLANLGNTLVRNAAESEGKPAEYGVEPGLLERYVWSSRLSPLDSAAFKQEADVRARRLLGELDLWLGEREQRHSIDRDQSKRQRTCGLGVYIFEGEDSIAREQGSEARNAP
jgi:hypothetical protein